MTVRRILLGLLVAAPIVLNAVALLPELRYPVPNVNDDAEHLLMARAASEALSAGRDPVDVWVPQLELGFPQFLYYQPLAHLTVAVIERALLGTMPLRTVFDLVRYLLLVLFPLTVLWSTRRMGLSASAAAVAAGAASLISGAYRYGFEYESYLWSGWGLFTQLFGMHLAFIALAALHRVLRDGRGVVAAGIACAALVLGHLIYAYMLGIGAVVLLVVHARRQTIRSRTVRSAGVALLAFALTAFFVVPFFTQAGYLNIDPYLERYKLDSFGAGPILGWLVSGDLFDHGRPPVLTALLALGIVVAGVRRDRVALGLAALGAVMLVLYFGRPTLGPLVDLLPLHEGLLLHRFIGGVDLAAIPLIGVGGGWLFDRAGSASPRRAMLVGTGILLAFTPVFGERWAAYAQNGRWLRETSAALAADNDLRAVLDRIAGGAPGRVYAGLRTNWGATLDFGLSFSSVKVFNVLADRGLDAVGPVYRGASLNSDLFFDFDDRSLGHYDLFDVDYVIAPPGVALPAALVPVLRTSRYILYVAPGGGYARYVEITGRLRVATQPELFAAERAFVLGDGPATARYLRFDYGAGAPVGGPSAIPGCPGGQIGSERPSGGRIELIATCDRSSALVLKITYHPNWQVTVDGVPTPTFMASPSYIGMALPPGRHQIVAEYRPTPLKLVLLGVAGLVLAVLGGTVVVRRRRERSEDAGRRRAGTDGRRGRLSAAGRDGAARAAE